MVRKSLFQGSRQLAILLLQPFCDLYLDCECFRVASAEIGLNDSKGLDQCKDVDISGFLDKG